MESSRINQRHSNFFGGLDQILSFLLLIDVISSLLDKYLGVEVSFPQRMDDPDDQFLGWKISIHQPQ